MPSDPELLQRARQFHSQTLAEIYDAHSPGLYRYALRLLGDQNMAEDCVAETFSRFLFALRSGRGPTDYLQAYLYRTAHNWITDIYRRDPPLPEELDEEQRETGSGPEENAEKRIRQEMLREALLRLTADQQQVIALKYLEDWTNEDIARVLKKPVGAVKSLQHRALAALQRQMKNEDWKP